MWAEHWHRYHAIQRLAADKRVLDVACGEGYGSALLSRFATEVSGVDISSEAIAHATHAYSKQTNLKFFAASCTNLPFADNSFEVVVSFETIEHIVEHVAFLNEIKRVLTPDGLLIISSPNKAEYSDARHFENEFHVKELYRDELAMLISTRFPYVRWHLQRNGFYSLITPEHDAGARSNASIGGLQGALLPEDAHVITVSKTAPQTHAVSLPALYFLVLASADPATLEHAVIGTSVFGDVEEFAMNDYKKIYRDLVSLSAKHQALHDEIAILNAQNARLNQQLSAMQNAAPNGAKIGVQNTVQAPPSTQLMKPDSWFTRLIRNLTT